MYFNQNNNFYHGIMFHHFHDNGIHTKSQGSIDKDDFPLMKSILEELQQELYSLGASVYQQAGTPPPSSEPEASSKGNDSSGGDDVIDAEFTESK